MLCLFDLDGTLIDSELGITASIKHALAKLDIPSPTHADLRGWIGPPLRHSFAPLLNDDAQRIDSAIGYYHERFSSLGWREHEVYAGMESLIESLLTAGHQLAVVTSKPQHHAAPILASLPFADAFRRLYAPVTDHAHSEKASMIAAALSDFDCPASDAVMIGDRHYDIDGAVANEVFGIGVLWGFGNSEELRQAGASAIAASPDELSKVLQARATSNPSGKAAIS